MVNAPSWHSVVISNRVAKLLCGFKHDMWCSGKKRPGHVLICEELHLRRRYEVQTAQVHLTDGGPFNTSWPGKVR